MFVERTGFGPTCGVIGRSFRPQNFRIPIIGFRVAAGYAGIVWITVGGMIGAPAVIQSKVGTNYVSKQL